jgi:hypothetical protein
MTMRQSTILDLTLIATPGHTKSKVRTRESRMQAGDAARRIPSIT